MQAVPFLIEHTKQLLVPEHLFENAVTVLDGETVLGVIGAHRDGDAVEVWAILSDEARGRPITLCRFARKLVKELVLEHGLIKARAIWRSDRRFAQLLGFVFDNDVGELRA